MSDDPPRTDPPPPASGASRRQHGSEPLPRRPDERDESTASQQMQSPQAQRDMQLAHDDLAAGRVDTDARGAEAGRAMRQLRADEPGHAPQRPRADQPAPTDHPGDPARGPAAAAAPAPGRSRSRHRPQQEE